MRNFGPLPECNSLQFAVIRASSSVECEKFFLAISMDSNDFRAELLAVENARERLFQPATRMGCVDVSHLIYYLAKFFGRMAVDMASTPCFSKLLIKLCTTCSLLKGILFRNGEL
mmetsp:Transcript_31182/g.56544  ORF Transcript_31182/g.56544 Transcript_31182/m.56544 type:complete len:115 (+) Transcript_31182:17-361(+)